MLGVPGLLPPWIAPGLPWIAMIRTIKENLLWVQHFATVAELLAALRESRRRYNEQWLIERHGYRTPSQARSDACRGSKPLETEAGCRRVG